MSVQHCCTLSSAHAKLLTDRQRYAPKTRTNLAMARQGRPGIATKGLADSTMIANDNDTQPCTSDAEGRHKYSFAPLIFPCRTRDGVVLLDLKRNRYLGLSCADARALSRCVNGLPKPDQRMELEAGVSAGEPTMALLDSLLADMIITSSQVGSNEVVSTAIRLHGPLVSIGEEMTEKCRVRITHVVNFLVCLLSSAASLKCVPLRYIVRRVYRRRSRAIANGYTLNLSHVSMLVDAFRSVRPYFFLAKDHCLLHALTLVHYLAHYGEFPLWVFGVATDPWAAHSWVQHEEFLLDCNPDKLCSLEPILAI